MTTQYRIEGACVFARSPVLIGGVGGSGTRVVARILAKAGFFIGAKLNYAEDSEPIMDFLNAWLRPYLSFGGSLPDQSARSSADDFWQAIADHRQGIESADHPWAIKVPRSFLMLPYWRQKFPELLFIHVIRNGLDMAYSADTNQLEMFQAIVLSEKEQELPLALRAMAYWRTVNLKTATIAEALLGSHYFLLRFEDLCHKPQSRIERLAEFVGTPIDLGDAIRQIVPPPTINRWRARPTAEIGSLINIGEPALARFGYISRTLIGQLET
jgi:hypothetical protein